jgi:hypothetical protein
MVTVIRPSRARCVKERIPRHARAVFTLKQGGMLVASYSVFGFNYSRRQLMANAAMTASRVASEPCLGVPAMRREAAVEASAASGAAA